MVSAGNFSAGCVQFCGDFYVPSPTGGLAPAVRLFRHFTIATLFVIPTKAGIQTEDFDINSLDSCLRRNDGIFVCCFVIKNEN